MKSDSKGWVTAAIIVAVLLLLGSCSSSSSTTSSGSSGSDYSKYDRQYSSDEIQEFTSTYGDEFKSKYW